MPDIDYAASNNVRAEVPGPDPEDVTIHIKRNRSIPQHVWLQFTSDVYADVVKRMIKAGLAP